MNTNKIRELLKALRIIMRCPNCGRQYNTDEIFFTGSAGNNYFLKLQCANCRAPILATVAINGNLITNGKIGQAKISDIQPKKQKHTIRANDILQLHEFLKNFDGNFRAIFKKSFNA